MRQRFAPCFFLFFFLLFFLRILKIRQQGRLTTSLDLLPNINQVFEYSNNDGENFKQLPPYLAYLMF